MNLMGTAEGNAMAKQTLSGIKVVDLTRVLTGPYCTMMLGDMGADVIKIEQPGKGDDTRAWGPPFIDGESAYYLSINRNKRSLTLNLKSEQGKEIIWKLIEDADVVVENFSPGAAGRLGLDYESVRQRKPDIVYCSISGFGQEGPWKNQTAFDLIVQGMSGLMSVTGFEDGQPTRFGVPIADIAAGMFGAYATVAALFHRERTGEGQHIDTSMLGGGIALLSYQAAIYFATNQQPARTGNAHPIVAPYQTFRTKDGYVNVASGNDAIWARFCNAIGMEHLLDDARFTDNAGRITQRKDLEAEIEKTLTQHTTDEVIAILEKASVPCGPIATLPDVFSSPQVEHYKLRQRVPHPTLGEVDQTGFPYFMSATPCEIRTAPPTLGQHTEEILRELGYDKAAIQACREAGAV
jgi:formyl-CoA transferase